jgi:tetratricopeptide (TPR) repeat protein
VLRIFLLYSLLIVPLYSLAAEKQLSRFEYQQLNGAFQLMEKEQWRQAKTQLLAAKSSVESDYANALISHNLAQIYLRNDEYDLALKYLKEALVLNVLEEKQQLNIHHTLGQVYALKEQWELCVKHMLIWMKAMPNLVQSNDQLLIAQAYAQLSRWSSVIPHIRAAIATKKIAPESWYQLKVVAHVQLKQWAQAVKQQQARLGHYSTVANWRQLVSLQIQAGQERNALATQRLGYSAKLLRTGKDRLLLAQLMLSQNMPYQAAEVLEQGLKDQTLNVNIKHLKLLGQAWALAKENKRAAAVFARLYRMDKSSKTALQLVDVQIKGSDWHGAEKTLNLALSRSLGEYDLEKLQFMQGVVRLNMKRYDAARESFSKVADEGRYQKLAVNWMDYIEQIDELEKLRRGG